MEIWLWALIGIMAMIIIALFVKIYFLRKAAGEIETAFSNKLITDTNALIDISTGDKYMRSLANSINIQLRKLREERHRYQQGDRELKEAVTNLSHDLRTPLTAIQGYLDLLETEEDLPTIRKDLAIIRERTDAMTALTEELFRYSVATSPEQALHPQPLSLNDALCESLAAFYAAFTAKGITPQISLPETPVMRTLDEEALRRVFGNILSNAAKYSGGDLAVTLAADGTMTFANTAPQLSAVDVQRLFNRFYTVESGGRSTGLGLAIAKNLAERMGGSISAARENGRLCVTVKFAAG